jgi:hypothetical protein
MEDLAEDFLALEYEAAVNGNCNFCFFPEATERFRNRARRLYDVLNLRIDAEEAEDNDDALCLLMSMVDESPHALPVMNDVRYQALRRVLVGLGILNVDEEVVTL